MIRITRVASVAVIAMLAATLPVQAAIAYFTQAKLIKRADTSVPIAGPGTVVIQVLVNANGTHKVTHIIRSTNAGDNDAAIDIAVRSTYRPQHRGNTPVTGFYDFTIKFTGRSTASSGSRNRVVAPSGGGSQLDAMIRAGNYTQAKARAEQLLASNPNNALLNEQLGTANFFLKDYASAAAAFDKVPSVSKIYMQVAAQSYALAAEQLVQSDPTSAVAYGQKAVALAPSGGTYYALGAAELNAGSASAAIADLQKARTAAFADPKTDVKTKVNIDSVLLQAYIKANDSASASRIGAEISQIDPGNTTTKRLIGNQDLAAGNTASRAGNHQDALNDFLKAVQDGDTGVQVTGYASAALEENDLLNKVQSTTANDYITKMKPYADKALALNPNDPLANFALGVAMTGAWIVGGKTRADYKTQAVDALNKAKAAAQAQGNIALSLNIDNFLKQNIK